MRPHGEIVGICNTQIDGRRFGPAWKLLAIVANNALSYDCCVLSPGLLRPFAVALDECVLDATETFIGTKGMEPITAQRLRLPRQFGGCDLPSNIQRSRTGFLSQYLAVIPGVIRDLREAGMSRQAIYCALNDCR